MVTYPDIFRVVELDSILLEVIRSVTEVHDVHDLRRPVRVRSTVSFIQPIEQTVKMYPDVVVIDLLCKWHAWSGYRPESY